MQAESFSLTLMLDPTACSLAVFRKEKRNLPACCRGFAISTLTRCFRLGCIGNSFADASVFVLFRFPPRHDECLNANWFTSLSDARRKIETWQQDYNQQRPHSSLKYLPPAEFARTLVEMRA